MSFVVKHRRNCKELYYLNKPHGDRTDSNRHDLPQPMKGNYNTQQRREQNETASDRALKSQISLAGIGI